jgi:SDR family mycofactocin-dependent oxidoreductase
MGKLNNKIAFITGVARGQGRSHAVLLAQEGADIIGVDLCQQIDTVNYPMASESDMDETVKLVEDTGRRIIALKTDVRDQDALDAAVDHGLRELGGTLDIVLANAGIMTQSLPPHPKSRQAWSDAIDVMLTGVWNTLQVTVPRMIQAGNGGAIVITSSASGHRPLFTDYSGGFDSYVAAKFGVIGLMRTYAAALGEHGIRVNSVHPTGVETPMVMNDFFAEYIASNPKTAERVVNTLPVAMVQAIDISRAILYLVSEDGRYVTGIQLPVDAGLSFAS